MYGEGSQFGHGGGVTGGEADAEESGREEIRCVRVWVVWLVSYWAASDGQGVAPAGERGGAGGGAAGGGMAHGERWRTRGGITEW